MFFVVATFLCVAAVLLIFFFLFYFSLPVISGGFFKNFLVSSWDPDNQMFGVFPMILGTVYIAGLAILIAAPLGIALAAFIQFFAPRVIGKLFTAVIEFMAGIPTVVYGFSALFFLGPTIRNSFKHGSGLCILTASLVLSLLILPTIVLIAKDRLEEVPKSHIFVAQSLGATRLQTFIYILLPGAWRGLFSAVILGAGRAAGDTLIALMLAGNAISIPHSILDPARTLTSHIALVKAADYESMNFKSIFVCGLILFLFSAWNIIFLRIVEQVKK